MEFDLKTLTPCQSKQASVGDIFGRLTVLHIGRTSAPVRYLAVCSCECGISGFAVQVARLKSGRTKSCGCFIRDSKLTHGLYYEPLYKRWFSMMSRCYKTSTSNFSDYGGRGIKVCERWLDAETFIADMSASFKQYLQLDRIDNNKDYSPENCHWVSQSENLSNRRNTVMVTHMGVTQSISAWSKQTGIPRRLLACRIGEYGWSAERALTTPVLSHSERGKIARAAQCSRLNPKAGTPARLVPL